MVEVSLKGKITFKRVMRNGYYLYSIKTSDGKSQLFYSTKEYEKGDEIEIKVWSRYMHEINR